MSTQTEVMTRGDGRTNAQMRPLESEQSPLNRADGSSRFSHGDTSVLVGIYGPVDVAIHKEQIDRTTIEVNVRAKGIPGISERAWEVKLRSVIESLVLGSGFPRTSIVISVQA
ncbi:hypothetical protein SARC_08156 [Sphaeroforma arctica JP610]|uniref:Exoribonuclease phosphorolytic domain-containing protein n=1 Tax=Sphaeroforma arctica JP610 TaxID=667725 RepID=A0A0L0FS77_9EUKA|nr:hypothetical protein SARC_08156 [Sphaeroforma arctica JP610]KNC79446.1 hypothetical protein SARC_08156 [Sphaeroforma arctica JP610]|eukprot:XP_014153348.1 hypothetical protein SARC_08156 [Sphaeroforma arctica JP610]